MKVCPNCKTENEDRFLFCVNCKRTLPRISQLEKYLGDAIHYYKKNDFRKAQEILDDLLKLNIGNRDAWLMKALTMKKMGLMREAYSCFESSGVKYHTQRCKDCGGFKRCGECGGSGTCNMCDGRRKCMLCDGKGACPSCGGSLDTCRMCGGSKECVRCKGTGECSYCNGIGQCAICHGNGMCARCGGTGKMIVIDPKTVSRDMRQYI